MSFEILDHLQNPILVADHKGTIHYFNNVCSLIFKMPPRKISNIKKVTDLFETTEIDLISCIKKTHQEKSPVISPEVSVVVNENKYSVILKFIPVEDKVLIHMQDFSIERQLHEKYKEQIMELRSTHKQILKSDKLTALGELIAGISHEISSPLTIANDTLLALFDHLKKDDLAQAHKDLTNLESEFIRIKQIVSNMQSIARNKEDSVDIVDVNEIINQSIKFSKELGILKDITVKTTFPDRSFIMANSGKLQQVFINMIKNSSDAVKNSENKTIEIQVTKDQFGIHVNLKDNGEGVKDHDKIFEMFYTTKELGEGTGLGLAISQKIINSFNGSIASLESSEGAHFCIEFPGIDVETFTRTNRYLSGQCELEDPKFLIFSHSKDKLNKIFDELNGKEVILVFVEDENLLQDLYESFMIDKLISLVPGANLKTIDPEFKDLSNVSNDELIPKIQELINE